MERMIQPLADLLGLLLNLLFNFLSTMGIANIGVAIILFTILVKLAMLPLTISQQKTVKITQIISPEIKAIRAKYRGRRDTESQQALQEEIRAVYAKYGASQTGGCFQMVIQMPILFALYSVFRNIPMHVDKLKDVILNIYGKTPETGLRSIPDFATKLNENGFSGIDWADSTQAVAKMNAFTSGEWTRLKELFPTLTDTINANSGSLNNMNNFFGINMSISPNQIWGLAILIPILAGVSQLISAWLAQNMSAMGDDKASQITQRMMIFAMPVVSAFISVSVPAGLGLYWIATAVIQTIMQLIINAALDKKGSEVIIAKNLEKRKKKMERMAKKGISQEDLIRRASIKTKQMNISRAESIRDRVKSVNTATSTNNNETNSKPIKKGKKNNISLSEKVNLVSETRDKKKK